MGYDDDIELMLTMGRALYRAAMYGECRDVFAKAAASRPDSADAAASLGYALHRLGDDVGAGRQIRRALRLDPDLHEARVYLGHLLYDRGDWEGALREFERVPPPEHWDALAVWRLMELKRTLWHLEPGDRRLSAWAERLSALEELDDPIDRLLAEVESRMGVRDAGGYYDPSQLELFEKSQPATSDEVHAVRLGDGHLLRGSWHEIVRQMRDQAGFSHETLTHYMRRLAERWHEQSGVEIPFTDPESFLRAAAVRAGLIRHGDRRSRGVSVADVLERFHRALIEEIQTQRPEYLTGPVHRRRDLPEPRPLRLAPGPDRGRDERRLRGRAPPPPGRRGRLPGLLDSEPALRDIRAELETSNPNTGLYREFAAVDVRLHPGGAGPLRPRRSGRDRRARPKSPRRAELPVSMSDLAPVAERGPALEHGDRARRRSDIFDDATQGGGDGGHAGPPPRRRVKATAGRAAWRRRGCNRSLRRSPRRPKPAECRMVPRGAPGSRRRSTSARSAARTCQAGSMLEVRGGDRAGVALLRRRAAPRPSPRLTRTRPFGRGRAPRGGCVGRHALFAAVGLLALGASACDAPDTRYLPDDVLRREIGLGDEDRGPHRRR